MNDPAELGRKRVAVGLAHQGGPHLAGRAQPLPAAHLFCRDDPGRPPDVRSYPNETGGGGVGDQVYQPLVESWLVISTWPAHGFTRVNLSSCKRFDHGAVTNYLSRIGDVLMDWHNKL